MQLLCLYFLLSVVMCFICGLVYAVRPPIRAPDTANQALKTKKFDAEPVRQPLGSS